MSWRSMSIRSLTMGLINMGKGLMLMAKVDADGVAIMGSADESGVEDGKEWMPGLFRDDPEAGGDDRLVD